MSAKKRSKKRARKAEQTARHLGYNTAAEHRRANTTGGASADTKRKPFKAKLEHPDRYFDGRIDKDTGRPIPAKGKCSAPTGAFVQFGARTKEGILSTKQRAPGDTRKVWREEFPPSVGVTGGMHTAADASTGAITAGAFHNPATGAEMTISRGASQTPKPRANPRRPQRYSDR